MNIYICPSPDLYGLYHRPGATVIVTDVFRATTTMTTAIANGAAAIRAVASTEECEALGKAHGYLTAAERNVQRCPFADFGNDPLEYTPERVASRQIVMTTTNGTRSIDLARGLGASRILIGSFLNLSATLEYCQREGIEEVVILAAGWQGQVSAEDCLYGGAFAWLATRRGWGTTSGDMASMMLRLYDDYGQTIEGRISLLRESEHYARLVYAGHEGAVAYCLTQDTHPLVIGLDPQGEWLIRLD